jgi:O-antigen/teichoic acid export membrane protein
MVGITYLFCDFAAIFFLKDIKLGKDVFLYSFVLFFGFIRGTIFGYFQSKEMFSFINRVTLFESVVKVIALLSIIFIFHKKTLDYIIFTLIVASLLSFIYALILFLKHYLKEFNTVKSSYNKDIFNEYWIFNIKTFTSSSLKAGNNNIDNLLIAYFLTSQSVGFYQIIKKILSPIDIIIVPFSTLVYTKLVRYFEKKEIGMFKILIFKITRYIFLFSILYILFIYFYIDDIFNIINVKTLPELNILFFLLSFFMIIKSMHWWTRVFSNVVNPNYSLYMNSFATIYQLTITVFFIYFFNIKGLIISIILLYILIGVYFLIKVKNYGKELF